MKLFLLEDVETDPRYCFVNSEHPCGADFSAGESAKADIERLNLDVLDFAMDEDEGGLELPDYVSNIDNMLLLRRGCAQSVVDGYALGEHELWPARLINEKTRVHSDDYVVLNPLGQSDCVSREHSEIDDASGEWAVNPLGPWCLRAERVPPDRDLFRAVGVLGYIFSDALVLHIQSSGMTNFAFKPVLTV